MEILIPTGKEVTIAEANEGYTTTFKLNDEDAVTGTDTTFTILADTELLVTNTLSAEIPTGLGMSFGPLLLLGAGCLIGILLATGSLMIRRRRRITEEYLRNRFGSGRFRD